jgi:preprotein translocase subunit YajC
MIESLIKGDKIVINGGVIVEITKVEESFYTVKNIDGGTMRVAKDYVAAKWED